MTNQHPITPPPELVEDWIEIAKPLPQRPPDPNELATLAARWGADQELEACCEYLKCSMSPRATIDYLRAFRRPTPPSLKEQALDILRYPKDLWHETEVDIIRRALEALND
jgi:hypothetical protein